ncbi:hypothetical protein GGI25_004149 [Coemansia spiralis]|uniref:Uncharacterized protein n=2 Tax=Coemansia TaxID=4863 RepID=A0A9W8G601_9FUNG|nr:hypothetical protein EDC05_005732 [Coemansia umbellata]KAJ2675001.1 hypothetical protein GGI25_004149 [Coemansia spiralis]
MMAAAIVNLLRVRYTTLLSGITYALNSFSYIYYSKSRSSSFTIATGPILGIGAGILWSAQGMMMMAYPLERQEGRFISIFWIIFNLGSVVGGTALFAINYKHGKAK